MTLPLSTALRPYQADDVVPLYEAASESIDDIYPWMPWCHPGYSLEDSRSWILSRLDAWGQPDYDFVIAEQATGRFLGAVGINQLNQVHDFANLGYWVRSSATGHGIAVAAVRLCARFGFEELKLHRLEIVVDVDNRRSQRVAEKAGATREGVARHRCKHGSAWRDAVMFSLLPTDLGRTPTPV
ncbi:diamine N-acetyltransferase [Thermoflexales bacterium]|nr:diamine N-acetyltransferase [Thermoflexales bacterium]